MWKPVLAALQGIGQDNNPPRLDDYDHDVEKLGYNDDLGKLGYYENVWRLDDNDNLWQLDDNHHDHDGQCCQWQRN